jgi:hypothetical protein
MAADSTRTVAAFDALIQALQEACEDMQLLVERAEQTRDRIAGGVVLSDFVAAEPRPLIITRMTELLDALSDAAAEVRRAEAHQLRAEGLSHERIAQLFGVTRQRAAALLTPAPAPQARAAKRPHRRDG